MTVIAGAITMIHMSHLHVPVPLIMKPPITPPIMGPPVGPKPYRACAPPLSLFVNMSPIEPPPSDGPAEPAMPLRSLKIDRAVMFGANAQPILTMVNSEKQRRYMIRRP